MRVLLDTQLLLWSAAHSARLRNEVRELIEDADNDVYYSAASIWEIALKSALRKRDFRVDIVALTDSLPSKGFSELPITARHAAAVSQLPPIHRDPFDRVLVAQSVNEPMVLLTTDNVLYAYGPTIRVV
ncbi:MAG TPA: type II toxin-antitoxin system VapC family toxin [Vicinamibacterales bacterium]